jgi:hypothetical protein
MSLPYIVEAVQRKRAVAPIGLGSRADGVRNHPEEDGSDDGGGEDFRPPTRQEPLEDGRRLSQSVESHQQKIEG